MDDQQEKQLAIDFQEVVAENVRWSRKRQNLERAGHNTYANGGFEA